MNAQPAEVDLFGEVPQATPTAEASYVVTGRLLHAAELRFLAVNDGVHTHALVLDLASDDTGGHIQASQPFSPAEAPRFERLAKTLTTGQRVQVTASLKALCLRLPHVQQVALLPSPTTTSTH